MTEPDDILVGGEFAEFRAAYTPVVHPAGTAAVRRTVRRRRRRTAVVTAAAVVLAVVIPVGANAALHRRPGPPPAPAQTVTPTPSESTSPPPSTPPPSTAASTPGVPDGRITRSQLLAARLDLVSWPDAPKTCVSDNVRLRSGPQDDSVPTLLAGPEYVDLDGDGATETVVLVACRYGEASGKQVLALDRDDDGRIITMGRVVGTREGMGDITEFSVRDGGQIRAHVADIQPCCGTPEWTPQRQWRTYSWDGDRFRQVDGPTKFGTDPRLTDLTMTARDVVAGPPDKKGIRKVTVTVTVVNRGPVSVRMLGFTGWYGYTIPTDSGLDRCRNVRLDGDIACVLDTLSAGASRTYTFTFDHPVTADEPPTLRVIHIDSQQRYWNDLNGKDNEVELTSVG
ncbi:MULTISPECIES: hypothetical protein [unclassified Micromonospora]|uniref:hypothetical protein n=1 Tax=unclassified Micromonospora TaxID=2617518 RepID=UPI001C23C0A0|nr:MULTISPECIES: hypothetical protein [unclassified Micromonospora]MBU8857182.1 hypothetical protein [Micromonospora sp. WMMB482]MDM4782802.1 hypothetical protein [Micromonospora sp. b486]